MIRLLWIVVVIQRGIVHVVLMPMLERVLVQFHAEARAFWYRHDVVLGPERFTLDRMVELEAILSRYKPDSRLAYLNRTGHLSAANSLAGGYSSPELASATVTAPTAALAVALATGTMVLGPQSGAGLIESLPGCEAYLVSKDLEVVKTL